MKIITTSQMRELDQRTMASGTPGEILMDRAGAIVAEAARRIVITRGGHSVLLFAGKGNNGGDAFVAARYLWEQGFTAHVALCCNPIEIKGDALKHFNRLHEAQVDVTEVLSARDALALFDKTHPCAVVDGLLGTGIEGAPRAPFGEIIDAINFKELPVIAIDVPSGMNSDTGETPGAVIGADITVTMGLPKIGLLQPHATDCVGQLWVGDIGLPMKLINEVETTTHLISAQDVRAWLPKRKQTAHKGDFGHVLALAGSEGYTGAAVLCAEAAARAGAGLVTLGVPRRLYPIIAAQCREVMPRPLADTDAGGFSLKAFEVIDDLVARASVVAIGPGLGQHPETREFVLRFATRCLRPMVMDADALNAVSFRPEILKEIKAPLIITPHPGEMARLLGRTAADVQKARWQTAREASSIFHGVCVLKGAGTVVTQTGSEELWVNATGNPSMAKGGSGDVLTGIIAGLMAQGLTPFDAARTGVYLHGYAGDLAEFTHSRSALASDILGELGRAFQDVDFRRAHP